MNQSHWFDESTGLVSTQIDVHSESLPWTLAKVNHPGHLQKTIQSHVYVLF